LQGPRPNKPIASRASKHSNPVPYSTQTELFLPELFPAVKIACKIAQAIGETPSRRAKRAHPQGGRVGAALHDGAHHPRQHLDPAGVGFYLEIVNEKG